MNAMPFRRGALSVVFMMLLAACAQQATDETAALQQRVAASPQDATLRIELADALYKAGRQNEAALALNEGLSLTPDDPTLLRAIANLYLDWAWHTGSEPKYATAERYLNQLLELGKPDATLLSQLAWVNNGLGKNQRAMTIAKRALALDPNSERALAEYASACYHDGKYEQGLELLDQVLAAHPDTLRYLEWQGDMQWRVGDYEASLATLKRARELTDTDRREWVEKRIAMVNRLLLTGKSYDAHYGHATAARWLRDVGRYDRAIIEYEKTIDAIEDDGSQFANESIGEYHYQIGICYNRVDRPVEALPYIERAIPYLEKASRVDRLAPLYQTLSGVYAALVYKERERKQEWLEKRLAAQKLQERYAYESNNDHMARHALGDIVRSQFALYGREGVDPAYVEKMRSWIPGDGPIAGCDIASIVSAELRLCKSDGDLERARTLGAKLVEFNKNFALQYPSEYADVALGLQDLASLSLQLDEPEVSIAYCDEALGYLDRVRSLHTVDAFKQSASASVSRSIHQTAVEAALTLGDADRALGYSERAKGRALLDLLGTKPVPEGKKPAPQAQREEKEALVRVNQLALLAEEARVAGNAESTRSLERTLSIEQTRYERLKEDLDSAKKRVPSLESMHALSAEETASFVKDFTFISYTLTPQRAYALVVNGRGVTAVELEEARVGGIERLVGGLKAEVRGAQGTARDLALEPTGDAPATSEAPRLDPSTGKPIPQNSAKRLYQHLFAPLEHLIDTEIVYICPDESLNLLPFEMLVDGEGRCLVERYAFAYTPSASVLKFCMDRERHARDALLALGNPNLRNPQLRLFHAEDEVNLLGSLFPGARVLTFDAATETAVRQYAGECDVLHLACHGEMNLDDPMLTSLRLAPDDANDGYLHAGEVFDLDLTASLVVLSACESGLGELSTGNELMGLTRAFLYAGAPAVVASLWKVDDASTAFLMQAFYKNLQTMNKAEALRQAKLETMMQFPEPFHWAAFRLEGDYR